MTNDAVEIELGMGVIDLMSTGDPALQRDRPDNLATAVQCN